MVCHRLFWGVSASLGCLVPDVAGVEQIHPTYQYTHTLVAAADLDGGQYLAFPVTVRLSESEILVGYKRGVAHAFDRGADFDLLRYNPLTERARQQRPALHRPKINLQNGEFVRFANGDIACYIDA